MHGTEEASKIWAVEVSTIEQWHQSEELMHLLSVTLYLIRRFTKRQVPEEECMVFLLSLRILDSWYMSVLYILQPFQRLAIHIVARVLNQFLQFSKINTDCPKYNTYHYQAKSLDTKSSNITQNNTSKLLQGTTTIEQQPQVPTSSQDTQLSATVQLYKQDKHEDSREFQKQLIKRS